MKTHFAILCLGLSCTCTQRPASVKQTISPKPKIKSNIFSNVKLYFDTNWTTVLYKENTDFKFIGHEGTLYAANSGDTIIELGVKGRLGTDDQFVFYYKYDKSKVGNIDIALLNNKETNHQYLACNTSNFLYFFENLEYAKIPAKSTIKFRVFIYELEKIDGLLLEYSINGIKHKKFVFTHFDLHSKNIKKIFDYDSYIYHSKQ